MTHRDRILHPLGLATALGVVSACGANVVFEEPSGGTGASGQGGDGAQGASSSQGGVNGFGGFGFGAQGQGGASTLQQVDTCYFPNGGCPTLADAPAFYGSCTPNGQHIAEWLEGPKKVTGECCYTVLVDEEFCGKI